MELEDRISELPQHILYQMLFLLPRKDAIRTCILSKSWRYLVSTRPWIEFYETSFPGKKHEFLSAVKNTLQRYDDQKLLIQAFDLEMSATNDSEAISVLEKLFPIVLSNMGLKTFRFSADHFPLPLVVFQSEFLEELFLKGCNLNQIFNSTGQVQALKRLRTLSLDSVFIEEANFEKIMSRCPLIENLVMDNPGLKEANLYSYHLHSNYFFPRLKSLHLTYVQLPKEWLNNLSSNNSPCLLRTLSLKYVRIEEETFEKILSICPLIQHLVLKYCRGLSTIKVKMARNLKHFECGIYSVREKENSIEINDAPSLETIHINDSKNWYFNNRYFNNNSCCSFRRLKSLYLWKAHLPTELLNNLSSNNCPCLEELEILHCYGSSEFKLSSRSIKRLIIRMPDRPIKVAIIDVANIIYFEYLSDYLPSIISFSTSSREWKSHIVVWQLSDSNDHVLSTCSLTKLHEFLKALSQSQISLDISYIPLTGQDTFGEPVVIEQLCLKEPYSSLALPALLNCLFRICRPRYVGLSLCRLPLCSFSQLAESIWKTLVKKEETTQCYFWQQDLEESIIQVLEENAHEWRHVQVYKFSNNQSIRFRLKWIHSS